MNSKLFQKLIAMGVTDSEEAQKIVQQYKTTGILRRV